MKLHEKLDELRQGNSHTKIAAAISRGDVSVTGSTTRRWCNGEQVPDLREAMALARHFRVPLDWLADDARGMDELTDRRWIAASEMVRQLGPEVALRAMIIGAAAARREVFGREESPPPSVTPIGGGSHAQRAGAGVEVARSGRFYAGSTGDVPGREVLDGAEPVAPAPTRKKGSSRR